MIVLMSKLPFFGIFLNTSSETSLFLSFIDLKFQLDDLNKMSIILSCFLFYNLCF